jgi:hypothetical protein
MAIDTQSAMTPLYFPARPERRPQGVVPVDAPRPALALAKLAGLVVLTTIGVTIVTAVAVGTALFAILNMG